MTLGFNKGPRLIICLFIKKTTAAPILNPFMHLCIDPPPPLNIDPLCTICPAGRVRAQKDVRCMRAKWCCEPAKSPWKLPSAFRPPLHT